MLLSTRIEMRFHVSTRLVFSSGSLYTIPQIVGKEVGASRILLITDKGIRNSGIADRVISQMVNITVFDEVEQNPRSTTVDRAGEIARSIKPDLVIGLGGGSAIDAAKAIALLRTNSGSIEEYEGREKYKNPPTPVLAIPTTCGTGSEVTWVAVITHEKRRFKMSIKGPLMFPAVAIVDPDVLLTLPLPLIASTGMDALTHAIEAYTVKPATHITDLFALESFRLIFQSIRDAYSDIQKNREAREGIMLGSTLAGMAFGNSDVGSVHCIAESIGGIFDVPHGVANSVFLPHVMDFNLPAVKERYASLAHKVGIGGNEEDASRMLIERIKELSRFLHIPMFHDLDIGERDFEEIATKSFKNNSSPSNPREAKIEDYVEILKKAYVER